MLKKALLAVAIASSFGATMAQARTIVITEAPPAVREERAPEYRRGFDWAPGHYVYRNGQYAWVEGHHIRERRGMHWEPERWVQRNGRWEMVAGHWARGERHQYMGSRGMGDRDHDGVPNRNDRDRDGDGVPNRFDNAPNNPNRR